MTWDVPTFWKKIHEDRATTSKLRPLILVKTLNSDPRFDGPRPNSVLQANVKRSLENRPACAPSTASVSTTRSSSPTPSTTSSRADISAIAPVVQPPPPAMFSGRRSARNGLDGVNDREALRTIDRNWEGEIRRVSYFEGDYEYGYGRACGITSPPTPRMDMVLNVAAGIAVDAAPGPGAAMATRLSVVTEERHVVDMLKAEAVAEVKRAVLVDDNDKDSKPITEMEQCGGEGDCEVEMDITESLRGERVECVDRARGRKVQSSVKSSKEMEIEDTHEGDLSTGVLDHDVEDSGNRKYISVSQVHADQHPSWSPSSRDSKSRSSSAFESVNLSTPMTGSFINVSKGSASLPTTADELQTGLIEVPKEPKPEQPLISFSDFKILSTLGSGAYGRVLRAEHRTLGTVHAIKMVPKRKCWTLYEREFVLEERRILAKLDEEKGKVREFFLTLDASFHDSDYYFFATPLIPGGDLMKVWKNCGSRFPVERAKVYIAELLHAIEHLHSKRICHRDIKLENVFLDEKGHIVLGDFGLARLFKDKEPEDAVSDNDENDTTDDLDASISAADSEKALEKALEYHGKDLSESPAGTPGYTAPEVLWKKPYSYPVDIWSLGVIMFQMLFGELPFWGEDKREVNRNTVHQELVIPDEPKIDEDTRDILTKMLTKSPSLRPDASTLKKHVFFKNVNWKLIAKRKNKLDWIPTRPIPHSANVSKCLPAEMRIVVGEPCDDGLYDEDIAAFTYTSSSFKEKLTKKAGTSGNYLQAVIDGLKRFFTRRSLQQQALTSGQRSVSVGDKTSGSDYRAECSSSTKKREHKPDTSRTARHGTPLSSPTSPCPRLLSPDTSASSTSLSLWSRVSHSWLRLSHNGNSSHSPDTSLCSMRQAESTLCSSPAPVSHKGKFFRSNMDSTGFPQSPILSRWTSDGSSKRRWSWSRLTLNLSKVSLRTDVQTTNR